MGYPAYCVTNLITAAASFWASTEDPSPDYGFANLYDGRQNKPFRWGARTDQALIVDLITPKSADLVSIVKHNFTDEAVLSLLVYDVEGSPSSTEDFEITWAERNIYIRLPAPVTYQQWQLGVSDPSNPDVPEIGELIIGTAQVFSRGFSYGWDKSKNFVADTHMTVYGTVTIYPLYEERSRRYPAGNILDTMVAEIMAMYDAAQGSAEPLIFVPDLSVNESLFCRLGPKVTATQSGKAGTGASGIWQSGIELREEADGARLT